MLINKRIEKDTVHNQSLNKNGLLNINSNFLRFDPIDECQPVIQHKIV